MRRISSRGPHAKCHSSMWRCPSDKECYALLGRDTLPIGAANPILPPDVFTPRPSLSAPRRVIEHEFMMEAAP